MRSDVTPPDVSTDDTLESSDDDGYRASADTDAAVDAVAIRLGLLIRTERRLRELTLATVASMAGVSVSAVHAVEHGRHAALRTYVRLADALERQLWVDLAGGHDHLVAGGHDHLVAASTTDPWRAEPRDGPWMRGGEQDLVHALMGEAEASALADPHRGLAIDLAWQHYRFGGRADVVAWDVRRRALLHIENKTQLPDVQDVIGRFDEKRAFLGQAVWERLGMSGPPLHESHVMVALWSAEVMDVVQGHPATFRAAFPSDAGSFQAWWSGGPPSGGRTAAFVLFDPFATGRATPFANLDDTLAGVPPRVLGYADAARMARSTRAAGRG